MPRNCIKLNYPRLNIKRAGNAGPQFIAVNGFEPSDRLHYLLYCYLQWKSATQRKLNSRRQPGYRTLLINKLLF